MSDNALVVGDNGDPGSGFTNLDSASSATNGLKMVDGATDAADAFGRGDWIEGSVNGLSAGLDVVGAVIDPIGTIGSMIAGWLMEHLGCVQEWLDQLCGDPGVISGFSATWHNAAGALTDVSGDYRAAVTGDLSGYTGPAVDAYRGFGNEQAQFLQAMGTVVDGVGAGIALGGTVLAGVREFISQLMADTVGQIVKLIGETFFTLGVGAPHAFATAGNKARELIQKARKLMEDLATSLDKMGLLAGQISPALEQGASAMAKAARYASKMNSSELGLLTSMTKAPTQTDDNTPYSFA